MTNRSFKVHETKEPSENNYNNTIKVSKRDMPKLKWLKISFEEINSEFKCKILI